MTNTATAAQSGPSDRGDRLGGAYWRLWSAAVVSRFGDALRVPALALLAASVTRDPRAIAAVVVAGQLPPLLFGLLGGVYADRWDRRRTMAAVDGMRALPGIVPADRLPTANGRLQARTAVAGGFVGAPAAGVLFAIAAALPFTVDAVSFAAAALLALTLRPTSPPDPPAAPAPGTADPASPARSPPGPREARGSICREAGDGLRWIRQDATLRLITVLTAVTNLAISGVVAVIVLFALDVLDVPEAGYGLFMAAAVLGGLLGGLGAGRIAARLGTLPGLRWVLVVETLALAALSVSRHPLPGAAALAVFSAGTAAWNSLWSAYGQRHGPANMLGRVGSTQRMAGLLTAPVGAVLAGFVAEAYGLAVVVYSAAAILALVTAASWQALRSPSEASTTAGRQDPPAPPPAR